MQVLCASKALSINSFTADAKSKITCPATICRTESAGIGRMQVITVVSTSTKYKKPPIILKGLFSLGVCVVFLPAATAAAMSDGEGKPRTARGAPLSRSAKRRRARAKDFFGRTPTRTVQIHSQQTSSSRTAGADH
eukprot:scaffold6723_cov117-Amphora_coffeaeformis.AAC.1